MSEQPTQPTGRRTARVARARFDATTVAAVLVPVLALVAALLVETDPGEPRTGGTPEEMALTASSVVCPGGGAEVLVTSTSGASGEVSARSGDEEQTAEIGPGTTAEVSLGERAVVVTGEGDLAPGLVAGRFSSPLASFDCRAPVFDQWFTGVGGSARHRSILQLVNPDEGRAVVDVEVFGKDGPIDAPRMRGVAVPGGESVTIPFAERLPQANELAIHVTVVRGRVAASIRDTIRGIGNGRTGDDGLASQTAPADRNLLLGIPAGTGPRTLVLANTSESQGSARISFVTPDSVYEPSSLDEVVLPPQSVVTVPVATALRAASADGGGADEQPVGLLVKSTVPATASLSMFVEGDLLTAVPVDPLEGAGVAVLPAGRKKLELGGATGPGVVTIATRRADGSTIEEERREVDVGRATTLQLPADARLVTVTPSRTEVDAVVLVIGDGGATIVRVREPVNTGLVPDVRVGLP